MFPRNPSEDANETSCIPPAASSDPTQRKPDEAVYRETGKLIEGFLEGEPAAVHTVAGWARSIALHKAWGFDTPEDIVQATLLALVQNLRDGRFKDGNLKAYIRRIAKNMCITNYRRVMARGEHVSLEESTHRPTSRLSGESLERRVLLDRILSQLNEGCRQIVLLAYIQGYSRKEIGKRIGISEEAARVKLCRCIQSARDLLNGFGKISTDQT